MIEKATAIICIAISVIIHSYVIGNNMNVVRSNDAEIDAINKKYEVFKKFESKNKLPIDLSYRIKRHIKNSELNKNQQQS